MPELDPEISKAILKQGNTATTRITSKGKSKELIPHKMENKVNRTIETRPQEGAEREILSGQMETMTTAGGGHGPLQSSPTRYKEQRHSGERKEDTKTREPTEVA